MGKGKKKEKDANVTVLSVAAAQPRLQAVFENDGDEEGFETFQVIVFAVVEDEDGSGVAGFCSGPDGLWMCDGDENFIGYRPDGQSMKEFLGDHGYGADKHDDE